MEILANVGSLDWWFAQFVLTRLTGCRHFAIIRHKIQKYQVKVARVLLHLTSDTGIRAEKKIPNGIIQTYYLCLGRATVSLISLFPSAVRCLDVDTSFTDYKAFAATPHNGRFHRNAVTGVRAKL